MAKQCHRIPLKPAKKNENILELMAKKVRQNLKRYKIFTTGPDGYGERSGRPVRSESNVSGLSGVRSSGEQGPDVRWLQFCNFNLVFFLFCSNLQNLKQTVSKLFGM